MLLCITYRNYLSAKLEIGFNVSFIYKNARIPNAEYFLEFSLKITVSTSHFDHMELGFAVLAAPLEKAALVCHSILEFFVLQVLSSW